MPPPLQRAWPHPNAEPDHRYSLADCVIDGVHDVCAPFGAHRATHLNASLAKAVTRRPRWCHAPRTPRCRRERATGRDCPGSSSFVRRNSGSRGSRSGTISTGPYAVSVMAFPWLGQAFRNNKATLCPPKPKESLSAPDTVISVTARDVDQDSVVRVVEVDGRRHHVVANGKHRRDRLDGAGRAQ